MRTIGFVLLLLGGLIIYLAWQSKLGAAFNVIFKGQSPNNNSSGINSNTKGSSIPSSSITPNSGGGVSVKGYGNLGIGNTSIGGFY